MKKVPQRTNRGNQSEARYKGGRPPVWRDLRLAADDAALLDLVIGDLDLVDALRRIAAAAAADPIGTRAALAPLLEIEAWDGKELL